MSSPSGQKSPNVESINLARTTEPSHGHRNPNHSIKKNQENKTNKIRCSTDPRSQSCKSSPRETNKQATGPWTASPPAIEFLPSIKTPSKTETRQEKQRGKTHRYDLNTGDAGEVQRCIDCQWARVPAAVESSAKPGEKRRLRRVVAAAGAGSRALVPHCSEFEWELSSTTTALVLNQQPCYALSARHVASRFTLDVMITKWEL